MTSKCCAVTGLFRGSMKSHRLEELGVAEEKVDDVLAVSGRRARAGTRRRDVQRERSTENSLLLRSRTLNLESPGALRARTRFSDRSANSWRERVLDNTTLTRAVRSTGKHQIQTVDHFTSTGTVGHEQHVCVTSRLHRSTRGSATHWSRKVPRSPHSRPEANTPKSDAVPCWCTQPNRSGGQ